MNLIPSQRDALWNADGSPWRSHRLIEARPGTGKTKTLSQFCTDLMNEWPGRGSGSQGIAALSYTNVAGEEIRERLSESPDSSSTVVSYPHFIGTLDSFINRFLFLPFGHTIMKCVARPRLVGEPHSRWRTPSGVEIDSKVASGALYFDCYSIGAAGIPIVVDRTERQRNRSVSMAAEEVNDGNAARIHEMKRTIWSHGYATQSDANYIALQVIQGQNSVARNLIARFPVVLIDEAQDMTELQHALVDTLRSKGHRQIVLVGDQFQAIYEWNTARPQLFDAKAKDSQWSPRKLSETFRCSPGVSELVSRLAPAGSDLVPHEMGRNAAYSSPVVVETFDKDTEKVTFYKALKAMSDGLCDKESHSGKGKNLQIAVLARSGPDVSRLLAYVQLTERPSARRPIVWAEPSTKQFLRVVHCLSIANYSAALNAYRPLLEQSDVPSSGPEPLEYGNRREMVSDLVEIEASLRAIGRDPTIADCYSLCSGSTMHIPIKLRLSIAREIATFGDGGAKSGNNQLVAALFADRHLRPSLPHPRFANIDIVVSTVHGVKGETYDGVIFYTKDQTSKCGCPGSSNRWSSILRHDLNNCESKRIAYVAVSRAAQRLTVLTTGKTGAVWSEMIHAKQNTLADGEHAVRLGSV